MTEFENHLRRASVRQIPPQWREEILAVAEKGRPEPTPSGVVAFCLAVRGWLWPHPAVWGALTACWALAGILCVSGPRGESLYAVTPSGVKRLEVSPELYAAYLKTRDALLAPPPVSEIPDVNRRKL